MKNTLSLLLSLLWAASCQPTASPSNDTEIAKELIAHLKEENEDLKAKNTDLKNENESLKSRIAKLENENKKLVNTSPKTAPASPAGTSKGVRASDLVGNWKAELTYKSHSREGCGTPGEVLEENWKIEHRPDGVFLTERINLRYRYNDDRGTHYSITLVGNRLKRDKTGYNDFIVQNINTITGYIARKGKYDCVIKYSLKLTRIR
ncbi:MAG: hypothetical protein KF734_12905 [Saprospiraceae bacterium]|nr:hypothetical protein [Saprospiraceae bacterium]